MPEAVLVEDQPHAAGAARQRVRAPWRLRFAGPFAPWRLVPLWLRRGRGLLLAIALGMLVAATLLGAVPIYSELVADIQLQYLLAAQRPVDVNVEGIVTTGYPTDANAQRIDTIARPLASSLLGGLGPTISTFLDGGDLIFTHVNTTLVGSGAGNPYTVLDKSNARPYTFDFASAAPHMRLLSGRLPQDVPAGSMPEVIVTPKLGLSVGDTVGVALFGGSSAGTTARVVGVWFPKDQNDPYWNGHSYDTATESLDHSPTRPVFPLVFSRTGFFATVAAVTANSPGSAPRFYSVSLHYITYTQPSRLTVSGVPTAIANLAHYRTQLSTGFLPELVVPTVSVVSHLDALLQDFQRQFAVLTLPLYAVVAQIAGLALFFVVAVGGLLVEMQADAIAALKSRGASRFQLVGSFGLLALFPAGLAAAAGVVLAARLALALVVWFEPAASHVAPGFLAAAVRPQIALSPVALAVGVGVLGIVVAAFVALRRDVLARSREQARGPRAALWQRYYLDLVLAVICAAGYLDFGRFGGLNVRAQLALAGSTEPDPLLVVSPILLLLAGALIVLRLLPLAARLGASIAARRRGATGMLAFADLSRATAQFTRLALLLALSVGMSLFALNFATSLDRNNADRAAYTTGGDQRLIGDPSILSAGFTPDLGQQIASAPGVLAVAPIARPDFKTLPAQGNGDVGGLSIDPSHFAGAVYWRDDYASQPLAALLDQMRQHEAGPNAGEPDHPIWALVSASLAATLSLSPGEPFTLTFQEGRQGNSAFVAGAIVNAFPTMYDGSGAGYLIMDQADLLAAYANPDIGNLPQNGPTEYWLRTSGAPADDAARAATFQRLGLSPLLAGIVDRRALLQQFRTDPVTAGMSGLLLVGTLASAILAVLACLLQAIASIRPRLVQFAVLRSLGMSTRQLRDILLGEQVFVYVFGLASGIVLGVLLSSATVPFLAFSDTIADPATLGVPPYIVVLNLPGAGVYLALLAIACIASVAFQAQTAGHLGLGRTLRIGED